MSSGYCSTSFNCFNLYSLNLNKILAQNLRLIEISAFGVIHKPDLSNK